MRWLLLLHQIPPKPPYFRAKILRRLSQVGALPVKNSAYLLPNTEEAREDFEWICQEIQGEGGTAWLFAADALVGMTDPQIEAAFRQLREADYVDLLAAAAELENGKLIERFEQIKSIDFFEHPMRAQVESLILHRQGQDRSGSTLAGAPSGSVWVTRKGIKVDRIGSAWLIQRFLDPEAKFRFVEPAEYQHAAGELRFDMYQGEFTHEGDLCTFEVLVARHGLAKLYPGLQPLAEMVHDIDLKDARYQRPETTGLSRMLDGLCARIADDETRLVQGGQIFEALYESYAE